MTPQLIQFPDILRYTGIRFTQAPEKVIYFRRLNQNRDEPLQNGQSLCCTVRCKARESSDSSFQEYVRF